MHNMERSFTLRSIARLCWLCSILVALGGRWAFAHCPQQQLTRIRPADIGVTHVQMLGQMVNRDTKEEENVILHAFIKVARMASGSTDVYGIGWVEGLTAGAEIEFMPEHLPYIKQLPQFELWAIDTHGNDIEGPIPVNITQGSTLDTRRMGFRMEASFHSLHTLFQLRAVGWERRYAIHTGNVAVPGSLLPWYQFPQPWETDQWTPQFEMMEHVARAPGSRHSGTIFADEVLDGLQYRKMMFSKSSKQSSMQSTKAKTATDQSAAAAATSESAAAAATSQSATATSKSETGSQSAQSTVWVATSSISKSSDSPDTRARSSLIEAMQDVSHGAPGPLKAAPQAGPSKKPAPPQRVPLVVVMTLAFSPSNSPASNVHYAQQLIRHTEYHLGELQMQRSLVYIHEALFYTPEFYDYISRYMPRHLTPYVTFILWNEFFMIKNPWYDQYVKYFHGVVALWGHGGAMGALIDIDEYIAFPKPQTTLQQALERCQATHLDWIRLTNQMVICDVCHKAYGSTWKSGGGDTDLLLWADAEEPWVMQGHSGRSGSGSGAGGAGGNGTDGSRQQCRWWRTDPLNRYNRLWNDKWFAAKDRVPGDKLGTLDAYSVFQGKHLIRGEAAVAFMHHRGELLPGRYEAWMDPTPSANCPYIAHLVHMNGFRPHRWGAKLDYFTRPARQTNWFVQPTLPPLPEDTNTATSASAKAQPRPKPKSKHKHHTRH